MIIPEVKKLTESNGVCEIPERLTYSASCELGVLGGAAEYSVIFDLVGGLIPPRSKETFTYLDPEGISGEKLARAIEMLEGRKNSVTVRAYLKLLKKISEDRNN